MIQKGLGLLVILGLLLVVCIAVPIRSTRPIRKIGLVAPFTAFDEHVGYGVIEAVRLAIREANLHPTGTGGYGIELVALDDESDPAVAAQVAQELAVDPLVLAALGGFDELAAPAAAAELRRAGVPFLDIAATSPRLNDGWTWRLPAQQEELGRLAADFLIQQGHTTVAIIQEEGGDQDALVHALSQRLMELGGRLVFQGRTMRWQLHVNSIIENLTAITPDAIVIAGRSAEAGPLLAQIRAAGIRAPVLGGPQVNNPNLLPLAGPAAADVCYLTTSPALDERPDLARRLIEQARHPPGAHAVAAYEATRILLDAIARAAHGGPATRARVQESIRTGGMVRTLPPAVRCLDKEGFPGRLVFGGS